MKKTIKAYLQDRVPADLINHVPSSFDILGSKGGSVAIIEIPEELGEYHAVIAEAVQHVHRSVKSVLLKKSESMR